ncbi:hypothetical protein [Rhodanobacter sp. OR87]|uniref:hypothetical protein n=1 Tax=Rhodanobacter sp. OR87 TaxID=1076523 RepID=UPI0012DBF50E|nr:hypothetical protein [Rhodanobacter sp. OR87]
MNILVRLTVVSASFLVAGCSFAANSHLRNTCNPWVNTFYKNSLRERIATFDSYDLGSQYEIFICGNQVIHPPAIYLAESFAKEGAAAVPLLKKKLAQADDDLTVRDIVLVFAGMQRQRSYDVSKDADLVRLIVEKLNGMHDPEWKAIAQGNLDKILGVSK